MNIFFVILQRKSTTMKESLLLMTCMVSFSYAQIGKVGIQTPTPTEIFDVNGTARIRSLPNIGAANSIYTTGNNTNSGTTPTQTFNGLYPIITDANGVLGKNTSGELVNNNTATGFNTTSTSNATFVVRRYTLTDAVGGATGTYNTVAGFNTGMDSTVWQAIMSSTMFTITSNSTGSGPFVTNAPFNYRLKSSGTVAGSTWRIIGDIRDVTETGVIDILFIKANLVSADARTN